MKEFKKRVKSLLKNKDVIYAIVCLLLLMVAMAARDLLDSRILELVDYEMLTSVVLAFLLSSLASFIARWFTAKFEDSTKLTNDIDSLVKKYEANTDMLIYRNHASANYKLGRRKTSCKGKLDDKYGDEYRIPVGDVLQIYNRNFVIRDDPNNKYTPPEFSQNHYNILLSAHGASSTFNQTSLRVVGMHEKEDTVYADFARTTYFDSLVTNRAIDYKIGGVSVRDLYACGPFLDPLDKSPLSNHMGFNGMVETSDGKFVFIKRHRHVSVGKNTMQCSVAASLKAKRALDENGMITKQRIAHAIISEIEDELNLRKLESYADRKQEIFRGFSFEKTVFYFYRDMLEGGKPQLMFYAQIDLSSEDLMRAYTKDAGIFSQDRRSNKLHCRKDGYKMLLVDRKDLRKIYFAPDEMVINGRPYRATPSAVGTVVMLLKAMDEGLIE